MCMSSVCCTVAAHAASHLVSSLAPGRVLPHLDRRWPVHRVLTEADREADRLIVCGDLPSTRSISVLYTIASIPFSVMQFLLAFVLVRQDHRFATVFWICLIRVLYRTFTDLWPKWGHLYRLPSGTRVHVHLVQQSHTRRWRWRSPIKHACIKGNGWSVASCRRRVYRYTYYIYSTLNYNIHKMKRLMLQLAGGAL